MDCTACGAELQTTDVVCPFCGTSKNVELAKLRDLDPLLDASGLRCPQGCGELRLVELPAPLDMRIAHCPSCLGSLFPPDGLAIAIERHVAQGKNAASTNLPTQLRLHARVLSLPAQYACPACPQPMQRQRVNPGIAIDVDSCAQHGDWVRSGNFELLAERYLNPRQPDPPPKVSARAAPQNSSGSQDSAGQPRTVFEILLAGAVIFLLIAVLSLYGCQAITE